MESTGRLSALDIISLTGDEDFHFHETEHTQSVADFYSENHNTNERLINIEEGLRRIEVLLTDEQNEQPCRKKPRLDEEEASCSSSNYETEVENIPTGIKKRIEEIRSRKEPGKELLYWDPEMYTRGRLINWINMDDVRKRYGDILELVHDIGKNSIKFRCFYCYHHKLELYLSSMQQHSEVRPEDIDKFKPKFTSKLALSNGWLEKKTDNPWRYFTQAVVEHKQQSSHKMAMLSSLKKFVNLKERDEKEIISCLKTSATAMDHMIKLLYYEVKLNIPMSSHSLMTNLLKDVGVNMGYHHKNSRSGRRIITKISTVLHEKLITFFKKQQKTDVHYSGYYSRPA